MVSRKPLRSLKSIPNGYPLYIPHKKKEKKNSSVYITTSVNDKKKQVVKP